MAVPIRRTKIAPIHGPIADPHTLQAVREIEKRLAHLDNQHADLQRAHDTLAGTVQTLSASQTALGTALANTTAAVRRHTSTTGSGGSGTGTGGGGGTGGSGSDGGEGERGLAAAGATGHVTTGSPLTPFTVGQIVGGVGNEFPALLAVAVDEPTRVANRYELLGRMIWHLSQAGFTAQRYTISPNPYVIIIDNLIDGLPAVYRVTSYEFFDTAMTVQMIFAERSARLQPVVADGGIAD